MTFDIPHSALSTHLQNLTSGTILLTPDRARSRQFTILRYQDNALYVRTQGGTEVRLPLHAFIRTLIHMHNSGSTAQHPSLIRSSNLEALPGGLCYVSRGVNGATRWITYVLPVLQYMGLVQINGDHRPNTSWLTSPS